MSGLPQADTAAAQLHERQRETRRVILVIFWLNLLVAVAKGGYGLWSGSLAVSVDAFHSMLDALANLVGLVALRLASQPPDSEHPYGHRKFETLAAACVGVFIAVGVFEFGKKAVESLFFDAEPAMPSLAGFVVVGSTWLINMFVASYEARRGRELESSFLLADAAHTASDVLVTAAVMAALTGLYFGLPGLDAVCSVVVLVVITRVAWTILKENSDVLVDRSALQPEAVRKVAMTCAGVRNCHRIRSRGSEHAIHLDLHLLLDGDQSLRQAHDIAHDVETNLRRAFPALVDVTIHMEPEEDGYEGL